MTKTAVQDTKFKGLCIMPDGSRDTVANAQANGFTIAAAQPVSRSGAQPKPTIASTYTPRPMTFSQLVAALPEAQGRPAAAAALAETTTDSLSLNQVASLLRGLPTEQDNAMTTPTLSAADVSIFKRRAELRVAALTFNARNGNRAAGLEARKINSGMAIVDETGVSYGSAFTSVGLDARATISAILSSGAN